MIYIPSYTLPQIKEYFPDMSESTLRRFLLDRNVTRWKPTQREKMTHGPAEMLYSKKQVDNLRHPIVIQEEVRPKKSFIPDVVPIQFRLGNKISFWEGSYKWDGTVKEVMGNDTYKVFNNQIGHHLKRWFEVGLRK